MATDREVLREIWEGKLPVCFQLNSSEVVDIQMPEAYYLMVPRMSYFPLVTDKVRKHFTKYIRTDKQNAEMWLEYNGIPLKWHYPIGVLFDMHNNDIQLPWLITARFDEFPEEELLHCSSKEKSENLHNWYMDFLDSVESHFLSCLKEADFLKHKTQIVGNMQKKDQHQLWLGLQNDKFDQFWAVNRKLMDPKPEDSFKYIPFKCYYKDEHFIQKLIKPVTTNGERKTLKDLFNEAYPENIDFENLKIVTQGIEPPFDTPLQWMSEHLSYPDNFLHFVITVK